jgi:uncharacterized damage-inducible protein DinB
MTTLQLIRALYDYHRWADERLLDAAAEVPEDELLRDAEIPFGSVQTNMLHIPGSQVSWVMRLTGTTPALAKLESGSVVRGLRQSFSSAHEGLDRYVASLTEEDVQRETTFIDFEMERAHNLVRPLWEVLLSVGSHAITHRSEVALVLTRLGASPGEIDYSEYAWRRDFRDAVFAENGQKRS